MQGIVDKTIAAAAPIENRVIGMITTDTLGGSRNGQSRRSAAFVVADAQLEATKKTASPGRDRERRGHPPDIVFARSGDEKGGRPRHVRRGVRGAAVRQQSSTR